MQVSRTRCACKGAPRIPGYRSGVLEFAALVNADLVAVGTRGQSNLRDVVLGSTAEKILRDSVCAVWARQAALVAGRPGTAERNC